MTRRRTAHLPVAVLELGEGHEVAVDVLVQLAPGHAGQDALRYSRTAAWDGVLCTHVPNTGSRCGAGCWRLSSPATRAPDGASAVLRVSRQARLPPLAPPKALCRPPNPSQNPLQQCGAPALASACHHTCACLMPGSMSPLEWRGVDGSGAEVMRVSGGHSAAARVSGRFGRVTQHGTARRGTARAHALLSPARPC